MNVLVFFSFILITNVKCLNLKNTRNFSVTSIAFENIAEDLIKVQRNIYLVNYGDKVKPLASSIMKSLSEKNIPYKYNNLEENVINLTNYSGYPINGSGIFIFDSIHTFKNFSKKSMKFVHFLAKRFQFFVYCLNATFEDLRTLSYIRLEHYFSFLIEDEDLLHLMTFVWYTPGNCNVSQLTEVNRFNKTSRKWENRMFSIEKNQNFHGCSLFILDSFTIMQQLLFGDSTQTIDLHRRIFSELANNLNYSLEFLRTSPSPKRIEPNNVSFDFAINFNSISEQLMFVVDHQSYNFDVLRFNTRPYIFRSIQLAVPIGEEYNGFEKLLLPFDSHTWNWILIIFASAFVLIFILKFLPRAKQFVVGRSVSTPSLNVLMIFSGTSQVIMPGRNFARFLVMQFILYSMIIRTAWQGKMFEFLQKEIRKPEVQTFDEMIEKNFTFFMTAPYVSNYKGSDFAQRAKIEEVGIKDLIFNYTPKVFDSSFKGAVQVYHDRLKIQATETNGTFLKRIFTRERISIEMISFTFKSSNKFFDVFDKKLQQLFTSGLINYYEKDYGESLAHKRYEKFQKNGPKVLTMDNLRAGFTVWLVSVGFSFVVFIFEWIKTLGEYFLVKFILNTFYNQKIEESRKKHDDFERSQIITYYTY